jgi:hypothetical protein
LTLLLINLSQEFQKALHISLMGNPQSMKKEPNIYRGSGRTTNPFKNISLEDLPTSKEDDNKGWHPTTGEATSLGGAPTPIIFTPTDWAEEREDQPTPVEGRATRLEKEAMPKKASRR